MIPTIIRLRLLSLALIVLTLLGGGAILAGPGSAALASSRRCSQSVRTTHNTQAVTVTVLIRYCNRSYRAWAFDAVGRLHRSRWITHGSVTILLRPIHGGYEYERTGSGGPVTRHYSF